MKALLALFALAAPAALASDLVGPASCRSCHEEAYRAWSSSAHARAAQALAPEQRRQALCLTCHSRDEQRSGQAEVQGVSCETCHGGGRYYQLAPVMRDKELSRLFGLSDPTPQSCMVCHGGESPSLQPFDVKEGMRRIDHWSADRAARKQQQSRNLIQGGPRPHPAAIVPRRSDMKLAAWLRAKGGP